MPLAYWQVIGMGVPGQSVTGYVIWKFSLMVLCRQGCAELFGTSTSLWFPGQWQGRGDVVCPQVLCWRAYPCLLERVVREVVELVLRPPV